MILDLQNINKSYGEGKLEVPVLFDINLQVDEGEYVAIMGPSGSGKSTLMNIIGCLDVATSGTYILDGENISGRTDAELSRLRNRTIGFVFQNFNLMPRETALDNVALPMLYAGVPRKERMERARKALEQVGLGERVHFKPTQLSGGQKQRIAIARSLASDPEVLMCDEATSALDPTTTRAILALIKDINRRLGITAIIITHEMSVIEEICSHVAILDKGHVAEIGAVEEIFTNPKTEAARRLVYPNGAPVSDLKSDRVVRIAFNGGTSYSPLIASLAIDCGVKVNILGADTRNVGGKAFGTMLIGLPNDPEGAEKALNYIRRQKDVTCEEVEYSHD